MAEAGRHLRAGTPSFYVRRGKGDTLMLSLWACASSSFTTGARAPARSPPGRPALGLCRAPRHHQTTTLIAAVRLKGPRPCQSLLQLFQFGEDFAALIGLEFGQQQIDPRAGRQSIVGMHLTRRCWLTWQKSTRWRLPAKLSPAKFQIHTGPSATRITSLARPRPRRIASGQSCSLGVCSANGTGKIIDRGKPPPSQNGRSFVRLSSAPA